MDNLNGGGSASGNPEGDRTLFDLHLDAVLPLFDQPLQKRILHSIEVIENAFSRYG
jgi:hypothetical protein